MTAQLIGRGRCHCGNLELMFDSRRQPEELPVREDACSFCRSHGARTTSDPSGRVRIAVHAPDQLSRYRFGLQTADFLVCRRCGVYLAAVLMTEEGTCYATANINTFDSAKRFTQPPVLVSYGGETEAQRIARRVANWTPVVAIVESVGR